jgi:hypothetical protein
MESNYRNRDFEQYIKENADQYRMFPSEKVWKNINGTLHTRRKWYGFGLGLLLLVTGTAVTWVMVSYPVSKTQPVAAVKPNPATPVTSSRSTSPETIEKVLPFSHTAAASKKSFDRETGSGNAPSFILQNDPAKLSVVISPEQPIIARIEKVQFLPVQKSPLSLQNAGSNYESYESDDEIQTGIASSPDRHPLRMPSSDRPSRFSETTYPLISESATDAYLPKRQSKKISWQLFITPTISYRKLSENKTSDNNANFPFASSLGNVNKAVTHKPDMGLQVGLSGRYPITKNLRIRGGLQFNINRYDIKAFFNNAEVATINLNEPNGINSVSAWTRYRTFNGYNADWLKNYYFSVSAPIGVELQLIGNSKTSVGIAASIQPTYIIKDRAYLISSDYKNYAKFPGLIRHVNVNTGLETFVNYTSGKTKWQIGPQVRYQVFSSFHNKYPVKENLFDFGIKIGMTLNE